MPFQRQRPEIRLSRKQKDQAMKIVKTPSESARRIERARMILLSCEGKGVSEIARLLSTNRPKIDRTLDKVLSFGFEAALDDLPRSGRDRKITDDARQWIISLACQKPGALGYPHEMWTQDLLARHARENCRSAGYPALSNIGQSTVAKILGASDIHPHRIRYYLERRDPDHDEKMADVLCLYKEVEILRKEGETEGMEKVAFVSYDEKPGLQALDTTAPDLPPTPGKHPCISRDHEYKRLGTISLLAGIDLMSGFIHWRLEDRHRSREFVQFLKDINEHYSGVDKVRVLLDNHSAHISKETRAYLASVPNRFDFVFTPKHASWLNTIECFFSKMTRSILRGIRVSSKEELKQRIGMYLDDLNKNPVPFTWTYKMDETA